MGQAAPAEVEQLEHLVEGGRVAPVGIADGEQPLEVAGDEVAREQRLAGPHPVPVPPQRVDLAVVGQVAVGVGQRPRREGVGREPGVDEGQPAVEALVGQVGEERAELVRGEHALVDEGARRQRRHVDAVRPRARRACAGRRRAGRAARASPARRPGVAGRRRRWGPPRPGACGAWPGAPRRRGGPGSTGTSRHPRTARPSSAASSPIAALGLGGVVGVGGQEDHARRVAAGLGQVEAAGRRRGSGAGTWTRMPAPSPVATSAPVAPRWARCSSAVTRLADEPVAAAARGGRPPARCRRRRARTRGRTRARRGASADALGMQGAWLSSLGSLRGRSRGDGRCLLTLGTTLALLQPS